MFWLFSIAARDVEIQRRGVIWIFWMIGHQLEANVSTAVHQCRTIAASLARTAAIHVCFHDSTMTKSINTAISFLDTLSQIRLQSHFGSNLECRYNLMTFVSTVVKDGGFIALLKKCIIIIVIICPTHSVAATHIPPLSIS
jgi:regulator of sigma D